MVDPQKTSIYSKFNLLFYFSYVLPLLPTYADVDFCNSIRVGTFMYVRLFQWYSFLIFCVCLKSKMLYNCLCSSFFHHFSGITENSNCEFGAQKYFTDHMTANTIQLFVVIKGNSFWSILFMNKSSQRGIPQRLPEKCSQLFICIVLK